MAGEPVAEHLGRLVGALQGAVDHRATTGTAGGDVLGSKHDRRRPHQHRLAQILRQTDLARVDVAGDERRVGLGHGVDEVDEAGVAIGGALVEGVLADHVRGREQEQLRLRVTQVGVAGLVGPGEPPRGADRCGQVGAQWAPLGARELGHDALLSHWLS